ncbi:hypothetical protein SNEBB_005045 [Seison nebaliae]|nr:hypothetical protein SNEBB_005045 [Seison nebaliae]
MNIQNSIKLAGTVRHAKLPKISKDLLKNDERKNKFELELDEKKEKEFQLIEEKYLIEKSHPLEKRKTFPQQLMERYSMESLVEDHKNRRNPKYGGEVPELKRQRFWSQPFNVDHFKSKFRIHIKEGIVKSNKNIQSLLPEVHGEVKAAYLLLRLGARIKTGGVIGEHCKSLESHQQWPISIKIMNWTKLYHKFFKFFRYDLENEKNEKKEKNDDDDDEWIDEEHKLPKTSVTSEEFYITDIELNGSVITVDSISIFDLFESLKSLTIVGCPYVTNTFLHRLSMMLKDKSVEYLQISKCENVTNNGMEYLTEIKSLKELELSKQYPFCKRVYPTKPYYYSDDYMINENFTNLSAIVDRQQLLRYRNWYLWKLEEKLLPQLLLMRMEEEMDGCFINVHAQMDIGQNEHLQKLLSLFQELNYYQIPEVFHMDEEENNNDEISPINFIKNLTSQIDELVNFNEPIEQKSVKYGEWKSWKETDGTYDEQTPIHSEVPESYQGQLLTLNSTDTNQSSNEMIEFFKEYNRIKHHNISMVNKRLTERLNVN